MSVPQRVVDCFLMMDGRDIHNASAEYPYVADLNQTIGTNKVLGSYQLRGDVPKMYDNRSARFYASIGFPGRLWTMNSASSDASYINQQFWYSHDDYESRTWPVREVMSTTTISAVTLLSSIFIRTIHGLSGKGNVKGSFITQPQTVCYHPLCGSTP